MLSDGKTARLHVYPHLKYHSGLWLLLSYIFSCRFFLPTNFELDRMTSYKNGLATKLVSKWRPPKLIFQDEFLWVADTSEAETSISGKVEYLQKSKLSRVTSF